MDNTAERLVAPKRPLGHGQRASARRRRLLVGQLAAAAALLLAASFLWNAWGRDGGREADRGLVFTIPRGSAERVVPELESAVAIPTAIRFGPGETAAITIRNEDVVTHRAGPFLVGPGQTYTQRFPSPGVYPIACAVDPAESIVVTVEG